MLAFWRLMQRDDLDDEAAPATRHRPPGFGQPGTTPERPGAESPIVDAPRTGFSRDA